MKKKIHITEGTKIIEIKMVIDRTEYHDAMLRLAQPFLDMAARVPDTPFKDIHEEIKQAKFSAMFFKMNLDEVIVYDTVYTAMATLISGYTMTQIIDRISGERTMYVSSDELREMVFEYVDNELNRPF